LYLKQVPSVLTLRKAGGKVKAEDVSILLEDGFTIFREAARDPSRVAQNGSPETSFQEDLDRLSDTSDPEVDVPSPDIPGNDLLYEDPFKVLAGWVYAQQNLEETPKVYVWSGGCHRIQSTISPQLCGIDGKNPLTFTTMEGHESKLYLIQNHTHWGHFLWRARYNKSDPPVGRHFAKTLWRRICFLLKGRHDPLWSEAELSEYWSRPDETRSKHSRAIRFIEMLKTVDGLFLQRFLTFPEEVWTWEKYDLFVVQAISYLIGDEFFDGAITEKAVSLKSAYSELKSARKTFKLVIHQDNPIDHLSMLNTIPRWVQSYLMNTWKKAIHLRGFQRIFAAGILSQTRGSGTPPPLVVLQAKEKFLKSVAEEPPRLTHTELRLINAALDKSMSTIPGDIFTGLDTKARVTVTGSACWEDTRKDGGTAQAILEVMSKYDDDHLIIERDLNDGRILDWKRKEDFESIGTAIFYACLQEVLETNPEELGDAFLTLVKEPGKPRSVTKGRATLKIVLDTISRICSYPLKKGYKSSESGMGKSHHGWNLFKDMFSEEMVEELFKEDRSRRTEIVFADYIERQVVWEEIFAGSTDFQEATDRMVHQFAELCSVKWMGKCGIPPLLQGIVRRVCYKPRRIFFTGTSVLSKYGTSVDADGTRMITLNRGVLMGDPLTKVILHFSNIVARELGNSLTDGTLFTYFSNGEECRNAYREIILDALS
jgi:hypothetical protein